VDQLALEGGQKTHSKAGNTDAHDENSQKQNKIQKRVRRHTTQRKRNKNQDNHNTHTQYQASFPFTRSEESTRPSSTKSGYIIFHSDLSKWRRKANHLAMWVLQECTQHQFSFSLIFPVKHYSAQFSVAEVSLMKPSVNETVGQMSCQYRTLRRHTWHRSLMHKNLKHL
jgi:hypothetical protein